MLKKAEAEQALSEEAARLRHLESRLRQSRSRARSPSTTSSSTGGAAALPRRAPVLCRNGGGGGDAARRGARAVTSRVPQGIREALVVVAYSDFEDEPLDLEIGFGLTREHRKPVLLPNRAAMSMTELPGVETLATVVRRGAGLSEPPRIRRARPLDGGERLRDRRAHARGLSRAADPAAGGG